MTQDAEDVRVCIPVEVVRAMIGLLENNHVAWPIAGAEVHRLLTAELAHIDGSLADIGGEDA